MPRLVACPGRGCEGPNYSDFRFCQWCGVPRVMINVGAVELVKVKDELILERRYALCAAIALTSHSQSKDKEFASFERFLQGRTIEGLRRASAFQAIPNDVVDFLVFRDISGEGRTVVHRPECMTRPSSGCDCPVRLSAESFRGIASRLRMRFYELGVCGAWNSTAGQGNPADSGLVAQIVKQVKEEQAKAGVNIMSARRRALLPEKLAKLISCLANKANMAFITAMAQRKEYGGDLDMKPYLRVLQDSAWFAVQFRSLNRGNELSNLRTGGAIFGPNKSCVIFQFTFSKVMRDGGTHEFGVQAREGDVTCPVKNFGKYVTASSGMFGWDWNLDGAFVFDSFDKKGQRTGKPVTAAAMAQRFQNYLKEFGMDDSETTGVLGSLHGIRAGGALARALEGESLADIMLQGFWKSPSAALHYIGLLQMVIGDEFLEAIQKCNDKSLRDHVSSRGSLLETTEPGQSYLE